MTQIASDISKSSSSVSQPSLLKDHKEGVVIIIDDEAGILKALKRILERVNYKVFTFEDPSQVLSQIEMIPVDLVLSDIVMPKMNGIDLCKEIKSKKPEVEVIVMTAVSSIEVAVSAMKAGAYDFLTKPFDNTDLILMTLANALERKRLLDRTRFLESQVELATRFNDIIGTSGKMKSLFRLIESVSPTDTTALVLGESGTGKELVARAIHDRSQRKSRPFLAVNCSALTETLLESEFFGHAKGAFTGALNFRRGLFEEASGGTIFLDEIGDAPLSTQVKLLRVIQNGEIKPVGSNETRKVDVRMIAATNVHLPSAIREGRFREDLYYRLNVITLSIPPLRERPEDIPALIHHFLKKYSKKIKKQSLKLILKLSRCFFPIVGPAMSENSKMSSKEAWSLHPILKLWKIRFLKTFVHSQILINLQQELFAIFPIQLPKNMHFQPLTGSIWKMCFLDQEGSSRKRRI